MSLYLQHHAESTQPLYETCFIMNTIKSMGYTSEPVLYKVLTESELNPMLLAYAEVSFSDGWDIENKEENDYWDSFVTE